MIFYDKKGTIETVLSTGDRLTILVSEIAACSLNDKGTYLFIKGSGGFAWILSRDDYEVLREIIVEFNAMAHSAMSFHSSSS